MAHVRCSYFAFGRPDEASHAMLYIVFIVISTAVRARLVHLYAPANTMFECSFTSLKVC